MSAGTIQDIRILRLFKKDYHLRNLFVDFGFFTADQFGRKTAGCTKIKLK